MRKTFIILFVLFVSLNSVFGSSFGRIRPQKEADPHASKHASKDGIQWESWTDDLFERAKRENKLVLLDLEAVWCHWCHVMDDITYRDPDVIRLLKSRYIAVKVDQDSRPDLSNRYEDYGWPAIIVFDSKGTELAKRSGYIPPRPMASMLQAFIDDPTPGPSVTAERKKGAALSERAFLTESQRKQLFDIHLESYDEQHGGWGFVHKYLDWDSVEYSMARAKAGDEKAAQRAKQTLAGELNIMDPVWGGVYQYSTGGVWTEPHFEKIMSHQSQNLRIYAQAYAMWKDPTYLQAAKDIHRFLQGFLKSPDGAFYTSMDADLVQGQHSEGYFKLNDAERRKLGIPIIDKHIYARENGWVVEALATLYAATGDKAYLDEAVTATKWIIANRSLPGGGFRHDEKDPAGPYLGDTLAMARGFLNLYTVTGDREWLKLAEKSAAFIAKNFVDGPKSPGFTTAKAAAGAVGAARPAPQRDENIGVARFANLLHHHTANKTYRQMAERAMKYVTRLDVASKRPTGGTLLVDSELAGEPVHIAVVGRKDDPAAQALFKAAVAYPVAYKRVEWVDKREAPLPNPDVQYPEMERAAAFACADKRCSLPVFKPEDVAEMVERLKK